METNGFELIGQGAEARLYTGYYLGKATLMKERFKKEYRHPELDTRLTKERIRAEARAIVRAKSAGVATPALYLVDFERRAIYMEYIEKAQTLKSFIDERTISSETGQTSLWLDQLAQALARILVKLHSRNIIHGDLTTSNVLIRGLKEEEEEEEEMSGLDNRRVIRESCLVLIDFGLARTESTTEDKAVDLYVLERSLLSSHSQHTALFPTILSNYIDNIVDKKYRREIVSKYEEVRARGRKRLMIG